MTHNLNFDELAQEDLELIANRDGAYRLWISALWPSHLDLPYEDLKEFFLYLLKRLLDEGKAVLFLPNGVEPIYRSQAGVDYIWDIPHEEMIKFMRKNWPQDVVDEDDINLTHFWYIPDRCPGIGWVDQETGKIVAS